MKYCVITACFGGYDTFKEPEEVDPDCEYIYVTDDPSLKSDKWKVVLLDNKYKNKSNIWKAFYVRYHIKEFTNRNIAVWVDASVQINKSLRPIVNKFLSSHDDICLPILWRSISTYDVMERWLRVFKKNPKKSLDTASFARAKKYITDTIGLKYRGHAEANFQIINLKNQKVNRLREKIWRDLLKLGSNGDPFRLDEVVLSVRLQAEYKILRIFKVCRQILMSRYMTFVSHDGKKIGRGYDPKRMCKKSLYFYNAPQKINLFL